MIPFRVMALFPVLLPVLGAIACLSFFGPRFREITYFKDLPVTVSTVRNPFVKAFFLFVPFYLVRLAYFTYLEMSYSLGGIYMYYLVGDYVGVFFIIAGAAFFFNRSLRNREPLEQYVGYLTFFTVILVLTAFMDAILGDGYWTLYELFLRPLINVALLTLIPLSIIHADTARGGGWAVLFILVAPFIAGLSAMWSEWLRPSSALFGLVAVCGFSVFGVYWQLFRTAGGTGGDATTGEP